MAPELRLMTANLLNERGDPVEFARLLESVKPDVVVTQELSAEVAGVLEASFPHTHLRPAPGFHGRGIASRLPARFRDLQMPGRDGTIAQLEIGEAVVHVVGLHFLNPIKLPVWSSVLGRRRQLEALEKWMSQTDGPLVVAGDMNASPAWPLYRRLTGHLDDLVAAPSEAAGTRPAPTWSWRPGWPRMLRIDHVMGRSVTATRAETRPILGSDHMAVIVDLVVGS